VGGRTRSVPRLRNCISCVPRCSASCVSVASHGVLLHVYQLCPEFSTQSMTSCVLLLVRNCISCVPRCSASCVSVASGVFNPKHDQLSLVVSKELYQLRVSCVPGRQPHAYELHKKYGNTKCPKIWRVLHGFVLRYYIHIYTGTYRTVEWYRRCTVVISWHSLRFKPYWKFFFFGKMIGTLCS
jgi:hypothetical protein